MIEDTAVPTEADDAIALAANPLRLPPLALDVGSVRLPKYSGGTGIQLVDW